MKTALFLIGLLLLFSGIGDLLQLLERGESWWKDCCLTPLLRNMFIATDVLCIIAGVGAWWSMKSFTKKTGIPKPV